VLGLPRNQGKFFGWRQRRVKATIVPPDADKIISVGSRSKGGQNTSFATRVWHKSPQMRLSGRNEGNRLAPPFQSPSSPILRGYTYSLLCVVNDYKLMAALV
jgi:hypothetical protein